MVQLSFNAANVKPHSVVDIDDQPRDATRVWSVHQNRVFGFVQSGVGNAVIEAVAGSGKSTTIVEALKLVRGSSLFLAFNKSIATELQNRGVNARTFHSLVYSPVMRSRNCNNVDTRKLHKICDEFMSFQERDWYKSFCIKLVGLARQVGIGCLLPDVEQNWLDIVIHHDMDLDAEDADMARAIELSQELLERAVQSRMVDFDDMLYLAVREGMVLQKYDFVFVDEAQDTNAIQRELLKKVMHANSRLVAVGDPAQAIYGFRGADSTALDAIVSEFNCIRLPLSISYRCPQAVVNYARQWVSHIEPAPSAPQGEVQQLGGQWDVNMFQPHDLVVCRTTKPVIQLAYKLLKNRVPVRVMGREIGQGLKNLINKRKATSLRNLEDKLSEWAPREFEKLKAKDQEEQGQALLDKYEAILCLMEGLADGATINDLFDVIDKLFAEGVNQTVLATIHKAKGLEADRVFWLNSSQCPAKWARSEWQQKQERNLCYVATTRAKKTLILIEAGEER